MPQDVRSHTFQLGPLAHALQHLRHADEMAVAAVGREYPFAVSALALGAQDIHGHAASLASSLAAYARRSGIFVRTAPNTFGLLELGHDSEEEQRPEPPTSFGKMAITSPDDDSEPSLVPSDDMQL